MKNKIPRPKKQPSNTSVRITVLRSVEEAAREISKKSGLKSPSIIALAAFHGMPLVREKLAVIVK